MLSPQWMLLIGIFISFFISQHEKVVQKSKLWGAKTLQLSVILLGSSLNFNHVLKQGAEGILVTSLSISFVFLLGYLGAKLLKIEKNQGLLITMGTAICGGSAIGALAPVLAADSLAITISIGIVFLLNAISIFIFPFLGDVLALTQDQFGMWSALAIHDTSSVVAASSLYGNRALEVATTVKLTRALWIIPIVLFLGAITTKKNKRPAMPWFILGFLGVSLLFTFFDYLIPYKGTFTQVSKFGFSVTLFFIGTTFDLKQVRQVGPRPFAFGVGLWIIVSVASLMFIKSY